MERDFFTNDARGRTAEHLLGAIGNCGARIDGQDVPRRDFGALLGSRAGAQREVGRVVLSLAEIAALQGAADGDATVRAALNKMAHLIDVGVSFG